MYNQIEKDVKVLSKSDPISRQRYNDEKQSRVVTWDDLGARTIEYQDRNGNTVRYDSPKTNGYTPNLDKMPTFSGASLGIPNSGKKEFKISFIGDTYNPSTNKYERIVLANEVQKKTFVDANRIERTVDVPVGLAYKSDNNTAKQLFDQAQYNTKNIPSVQRVTQKQTYSKSVSPTKTVSTKKPELAFGLQVQYDDNGAFIAGDGKTKVNGKILEIGKIARLSK